MFVHTCVHSGKHSLTGLQLTSSLVNILVVIYVIPQCHSQATGWKDYQYSNETSIDHISFIVFKFYFSFFALSSYSNDTTTLPFVCFAV